ncbi:MAG: hypothetical protein CMH54_04165, partial [Myxococcales bacterium]|nr:hypothetical protein [Myxococcales bacterium]
MGDAELVIVGAGPAGLCAAWEGRKRGWEPIILERRSVVGGAWAEMPPKMRCLSPRKYDRMPDGSVSSGDGNRATVAEILTMIEAFAAKNQFRICMESSAQAVSVQNGMFEIETTRQLLRTPRLIIATGEYSRPRVPSVPGDFDGPTEHTRTFDPNTVTASERVAVIGAGNSGAEAVLAILARGGQVVLSTRYPLAGPPIDFSETVLAPLAAWYAGLPVRWLPGRGGCQVKTPLVYGELKRGVQAGQIELVGALGELQARGFRTSSGQDVDVDRIVWATGYRRETTWL